MKKIKVGVIGLGVGEQHIIAYQKIPGVEVKSICDIDPKKLTAVANRRNISFRFSDYKKITQDSDIEVVSVCSFDNFHAEQVISAFDNGKHVFVEKPIALHRHESESIYNTYINSGKKISSNLILRTEPRFKAVKEMVSRGEFGDIVSIEGDYIHDILWKIQTGWRGKMDFYCVVYGGGIHLIDLMRWIIGKEISEVSSMGNKILTKGSGYRYYDVIYSLLRYENGTIGKTMSNFGPKRTKFHSLNIYGTKKTFINDRPEGKIFTGDRIQDEINFKVPYPSHKKGDLIPDFIESIRQDKEAPISDKDIFRVMDICFAIWKSTLSGKIEKVNYFI